GGFRPATWVRSTCSSAPGAATRFGTNNRKASRSTKATRRSLSRISARYRLLVINAHSILPTVVLLPSLSSRSWSSLSADRSEMSLASVGDVERRPQQHVPPVEHLVEEGVDGAQHPLVGEVLRASRVHQRLEV